MAVLVKTSRWQDLYWNELHPYPKILLCFLYDTANAGFVDYNCNLWLAQLKGKLDERYPTFTKNDLMNSLEDLKEKLISDGKNKLYIKDFLRHQAKLPLKRGNNEDNQIISKLQSNLQRFNNAPEIQEILNNVEEENKAEPIKKTTRTSTRTKSPTTEFIAPTLEEFLDYFIENDYSEDVGKRAWKGYHDAKWHDSRGNKVLNWKQKCQNNWFKPEHKNGLAKEEKKSKLETTMSVVERMTTNPNKPKQQKQEN